MLTMEELVAEVNRLRSLDLARKKISESAEANIRRLLYEVGRVTVELRKAVSRRDLTELSRLIDRLQVLGPSEE